MRGTLIAVLKGLLEFKSSFSPQVFDHVTIKEEEDTEKTRCSGLLNYWLEAELFDLPECPMGNTKDIKSATAGEFLNWVKEVKTRIQEGKLKFNDNNRLVVMFQCHRAGYLLEQGEEHPNYRTPRTFLVGQAMIPSWDKDRQTIIWHLSKDNQDFVVNLATIRTLYRKCHCAVPKNMSLSEWIEARIENIENKILNMLLPDDGEQPFDSEQLAEKIREVNRALAEEFWSDPKARKFMRDRCKPIESQIEQNDEPEILSNRAVTFRWRFCYYPDGNDTRQLGPFFVKDMERIIVSLRTSGWRKEISKPLQAFLLGKGKQKQLGDALNGGNDYYPLTQYIPAGRWPENPNYGLSFLQCVALNVACDSKNNPVVAVNGPPGTGKTTLLKDLIAHHFVQRTRQLLKLSEEKNWCSDPRVVETIMAHSMVVASSNNKAVENISKELPGLTKIFEDYREQCQHFRSVANETEWGLFCAVLGNADNRRSFKQLLNNLKDHCNDLKDHFKINHFYNSLKKFGLEDAERTITDFVQKWQARGQLLKFATEIEASKAYETYSNFFIPFCAALNDIYYGRLTIERFAQRWSKFDDEQWRQALDALKILKLQWFHGELAQRTLENKLNKAKDDFNKALEQHAILLKALSRPNGYQTWQLNNLQHLLSKDAYLAQEGESPEEAEKRLQKSSPFGSEKVNECRNEVFLKALAFNEALLENAASQFEGKWQDLEALIDGTYSTNELPPEHQKLWAMLFLFFPVISTSLSSVENQFKLMQKDAGFGLAMIDEAGQAVNYHVVGLLQRCRQAVFVGDPIQLEPIVTIPKSIDLTVAHDFISLSNKDGEQAWGDDYLISESSAQSIADKAGQFFSMIGTREVGLSLLVHRRCNEPMFSIANKIAYDNKMVLASKAIEWKAIQSGWIHVEESADKLSDAGYNNKTEASVAMDIAQFLSEQHPKMVAGGIFIISPFSNMSKTLKKHWIELAKSEANHKWMQVAFGEKKMLDDVGLFAKDNIGTVHTFQGKEASTVLFCTAASIVRNKISGISWVNSKPNLLNVAITRAKHHLFVIGNLNDWRKASLTANLQKDHMRCYQNIEDFKSQKSLPLSEHTQQRMADAPVKSKVSFDFR